MMGHQCAWVFKNAGQLLSLGAQLEMLNSPFTQLPYVESTLPLAAKPQLTA